MGLGDLIGALRGYRFQPERVLTFLAVAFAVALVALVVVLIVRAVVRSSNPRGRMRSVLGGSARRRAVNRWVVRLTAVLMIVAVAWAVDAALGTDEACRTCHRAGTPSAPERVDVRHRKLMCVDCHRARGVTGRLAYSADYTRWLVVYAKFKRVPPGSALSAPSAPCLSCHRSVASGTVVSGGIRVRHSDFLSAGGACPACHSDQGHVDAAATGPQMSSCLGCHNGEVASALCESCHVRDFALNTPADTFPVVSFPDPRYSCYSCHEVSTCNECHGTTMPHPQDWISLPYRTTGVPRHARQGFGQRERCWRCHFAKGEPLVPSDESCKCHGLFGRQHGGAAWVQEHGLQATGQKTGVFSACFDCHSMGFCTACHPASYNDLYAPRSGPDDYVRDIPLDPALLTRD